MRRVIHSEGCFRVSVRYLTQSRDGVFWFYRRIPIAAKERLGLTSHFVRESLSTRDRAEAMRRLAEVNAKHEARWNGAATSAESGRGARTNNAGAEEVDVVARGALRGWLGVSSTASRIEPLPQQSTPSTAAARTENGPTLLMSEALELYLSQHPNGKTKRFEQTTRLAIGTVIEAVGDFPLGRYTRQNALAVREAMLAKNKTTSVKRRFNTISAVFKAANDEHALGVANPFSGIRIANLGSDSKRREEFTTEELKALATACRSQDDERRHIVAMVLDTGARLGEVVGLRVCDLFLDDAVPYIHIRRYAANPELYGERSVKTDQSERKVPLVGEALWAAKRAVISKDPAGLLFPTYGPTKADSASGALNKWIKKTLAIPKQIHGLRHSMKTRLRLHGVPEDIQNKIGGWTDGGNQISRSYGSYPLEMLRGHLEKVVLIS